MYWHVVNTKPHQEAIAKASLEQAGIEVFCPQSLEKRIVRRQPKMVLSPLFPGYLFARYDMVGQHRLVTYARGVRNVLFFGQMPAIVDQAIIDAIKKRIDGSGRLTNHYQSFMPGQRVTIQAGVLQGIDAIFEKEMTGSQRAILLVRTLSYQARVVVNLKQVVNL